MLFRRRHPLKWWQHVRHALWPRSGWTRAVKYVWHRLARLKDSPHGIAAGLASGVAISFTPFMGFHLIGAMGMAMATRGNVIAAWIGTLIGNPWTFPVIWLAIYQVGALLIGAEPVVEAQRISFELLIRNPGAAIGPVFLPMSIGGVLLAIASWFLTYWSVKRALERLRAMRRLKIDAVRRRPGKGNGVGSGSGSSMKRA